MLIKKLLLCLLLAPFVCHAQLSKQDSVWLPLKPLLGNWKGISEGQPGKGTYERSYKFVLNNKFIEVKNKSTYPSSQENPKGEIHEDHGFISYDKARKTFVLRQFHVEGFVIQYAMESISGDGKTIVFLSESIENIPKGFRSKETYQFVGRDEFTEMFEIAEGGKDFELYSKAILRRVK